MLLAAMEKGCYSHRTVTSEASTDGGTGEDRQLRRMGCYRDLEYVKDPGNVLCAGQGQNAHVLLPDERTYEKQSRVWPILPRALWLQ